MELTDPERKALIELWMGENLSGMDNHRPAFPGAVGRDGAALVKKGLAERIGPITYERGVRYTAYKLTEAGKDCASECVPEAVKRMASLGGHQ